MARRHAVKHRKVYIANLQISLSGTAENSYMNYTNTENFRMIRFSIPHPTTAFWVYL